MGKPVEIGMNIYTFVAGFCVILMVLMLREIIVYGRSMGAIPEAIYFFGFLYIASKILIKKQRFSRSEKIATVILIGSYIFFFAVGFLLMM